jgi:hypothetical protein
LEATRRLGRWNEARLPPLPPKADASMPRKRFRRTVIAAARLRTSPARFVLGHAAAGIGLSGLFVGVLCGSGCTIGRLLIAPESLPFLAKIFVLHATLFACASFATSAASLPVGGRPAAGRPWSSWWSLRAVTVRE